MLRKGLYFALLAILCLVVAGCPKDTDEPGTTVEEYDPATNQWTTMAPMPTGREGLAVGVVNNKIYAIGGVGRDCNPNPCTVVEEYDPATDQWNIKAPMPTGRYGLAAGVVN
jgi:N-acetylneuraminic acid mutarotase